MGNLDPRFRWAIFFLLLHLVLTHIFVLTEYQSWGEAGANIGGGIAYCCGLVALVIAIALFLSDYRHSRRDQ